jgi:hypothetical protein
MAPRERRAPDSVLAPRVKTLGTRKDERAKTARGIELETEVEIIGE